MKYQIDYEYDGGSGSMEINLTTTAVEEVVDKLKEMGCRNIAVEEVHEPDPCDRCNRPICHGCEHSN